MLQIGDEHLLGGAADDDGGLGSLVVDDMRRGCFVLAVRWLCLRGDIEVGLGAVKLEGVGYDSRGLLTVRLRGISMGEVEVGGVFGEGLVQLSDRGVLVFTEYGLPLFGFG